ncbi:MAG: hypothetical protein K2X27_11435 [Candidatus Obscuribacterales bacterium]|nr:hypothetical protein [Candidatus Obscuribacterales bacterium]
MNMPLPIWVGMVIKGYLLTIVLEAPILVWGLGARYKLKEKILAVPLLTACSYPFVTILFPIIWNPYEIYPCYITISETFAPLFECLIFALLFQKAKVISLNQRCSDFLVIILANLFSFVCGEFLKASGFKF